MKKLMTLLFLLISINLLGQPKDILLELKSNHYDELIKICKIGDNLVRFCSRDETISNEDRVIGKIGEIKISFRYKRYWTKQGLVQISYLYTYHYNNKETEIVFWGSYISTFVHIAETYEDPNVIKEREKRIQKEKVDKFMETIK
jgi:hypothetical protein